MQKILYLLSLSILFVVGCKKDDESYSIYAKWVSVTDGYNYILDIRKDNNENQTGTFQIKGKNMVWTTSTKDVHLFEINEVGPDRMTLTEMSYLGSYYNSKIVFRKER